MLDGQPILSNQMTLRAAVFDVGGVLCDSPFPALRKLEQKRGLPAGHLSRHIQHSQGTSFQRLEMGTTTRQQFDVEFQKETGVAGEDLLAAIEGPTAVWRSDWLALCKLLIAKGIPVGIITNSWPAPSTSRNSASRNPLPPVLQTDSQNSFPTYQSHSRASAHLPEALFILESWQVGVRKPSPEIFQLAFQKLAQSPQLQDLKPQEVLFADDIGANLRVPQTLGWKTVLVKGDGREALAQVAGLFGLPLPDRQATAKL